jgi:4-hydroxyphenylpyruvate dioxygenase
MDAASQNPMGTDGFEFIEYTAPDSRALGALFESMGFSKIARHRSKDVTLYRQGDINFVVNHEPHSFAQAFARVHGPSVCAFAIRVQDAEYAFKRALELGAKPHFGEIGPMELQIPAIRGIGGSLIYLVDRYGPGPSIYDIDFVPEAAEHAADRPATSRPLQAPVTTDLVKPLGAGLRRVDHITHNVHAGRMDHWVRFYERLYGYR